jgi:hypothetical protein
MVQAAEERYSNEVLAHAESIKAIENLRRDLATAQASARDNLTAAETASAKLSASEDSWKQQKAALNKEVADMNARCDLTSLLASTGLTCTSTVAKISPPIILFFISTSSRSAHKPTELRLQRNHHPLSTAKVKPREMPTPNSPSCDLWLHIYGRRRRSWIFSLS